MHLLLALGLTLLSAPFDSVHSAGRVNLAQDRQTGADPLLSRLAGQWTGTGTVLNQPSKIQMAWTWELVGRFIRLTFRNQMGTAPNVNVFEGHAYYRPVADGQYPRFARNFMPAYSWHGHDVPACRTGGAGCPASYPASTIAM